MKFRTRKWISDKDLNSNGTLFGGRLLDWIDEEAYIYCACQLDNDIIVTRSMSKIDFMASARKGAIDVLSYLINYEVDSNFSILNLSNYFGQTPLMHAAVYSSNEVAEWLVQHGADVNVRDSVGTSVIEYGLMNPNFNISKFIKYLRSNDNVVNLAYSEHMISFGAMLGNLSVFDESPLTDIVPLNLSLVVEIYASQVMESFLAWEESNLCIPDGGKLNPLQVSLVAYFLDLKGRKMYKKDFIFKLLSHPKLHYMINEYLPNGMRAKILQEYVRECHIRYT